MPRPSDDIADAVMDFVRRECPPDVASQVTDSIELFKNGVLDSLSSLKLVSFLEERFSIKIKPYDMDPENFGTIERITGFVRSRMGK